MKQLVLLAALLLAACANQQEKAYPGKETAARESARRHTELGAGYYGQRQMGIALEEFTEAVRIDPSYALAYNGLGLVFSNLKEDVKADANFKKAIQLDPRNSESHNNYGTFLCSRNRIDESIVQFMDAVKDPLYATPATAYLNAGICSLRKQDSENAEIYLQQALAKDPLMGPAAYQLSQLYYERKQYQAAHNALQNLLLSNPGPEVLWLAIRIERGLENNNAVSSYSLELRRKYPDSPQAKALAAGQ